jgi:hypothetical protein
VNARQRLGHLDLDGAAVVGQASERGWNHLIQAHSAHV